MKLYSQPEGPLSQIASAEQIQRILKDPPCLQILNSLPDGLVITDQEGVVVFMNSAAESINDINFDRMIGRTLKTFCKKSVVSCDVLVESFYNANKIDRPVFSTIGDNILISARFLRDKNRNVIYFVIVQRNLDELEKMVNSQSRNRSEFKMVFDNQEPRFEESRSNIIQMPKDQTLKKGLRAIGMGSRVILRGESGVGKSETARYLHNKSFDGSRPFIHVNCSSIPETLFESEMFGYERGAFTGASNSGKKGLIEAADGGTLFLDEIGEVPIASQPKLLQFIEDGKVQRLGSTKIKRIKVNVMTATNRDLEQMILEGKFRSDLFYRINVIGLTIPALRERRELIPGLIETFMERLIKRRGKPFSLSPACSKRLLEYDYPGNIRELQNILEQLAVECDDVARPEHLPFKKYPDSNLLGGSEFLDIDYKAKPLKESVRGFETLVIEDAILRLGSKRKAASALGVDIATIVRKTKR
ncbi:MAG: transcriptional regulator [Gammaproteobacteria bacterium]|nr:MAG: transcriptional regulator [Gammaproteobacteria bacterium]